MNGDIKIMSKYSKKRKLIRNNRLRGVKTNVGDPIEHSASCACYKCAR